MKKKNIDLRAAIMSAGLKNYEVGHRMGLPETQFSKMLNKDLSEEEYKRIRCVIYDFLKEQNRTC